MASARHALPFNSQSHLMHVRDQLAAQEDAHKAARVNRSNNNNNTSDLMAPRESTRSKFARKVQAMLPGKKQTQTQQSDLTQESRESLQRRLVADAAMMHAHRGRMGRC